MAGKGDLPRPRVISDEEWSERWALAFEKERRVKMKAQEIKDKYVIKEMHDKVGVIAIGRNKDSCYWWHVHDDEELPKKVDIAVHIRI